MTIILYFVFIDILLVNLFDFVLSTVTQQTTNLNPIIVSASSIRRGPSGKIEIKKSKPETEREETAKEKVEKPKTGNVKSKAKVEVKSSEMNTKAPEGIHVEVSAYNKGSTVLSRWSARDVIVTSLVAILIRAFFH